MEHRVILFLRGTQDGEVGTRLEAEMQLKALYPDPAFPESLVTIASHIQLSTTDRFLALVVLKLFVVKGWSPLLDEFEGQVLVDDGTKNRIKQRLLALVFEDNLDSKVINQTAVLIAKIAKCDFPDHWPTLLQSLLSLASDVSGRGTTVNATLIVLSELLQDGLDEDHFSHYAVELITYFRNLAAATDLKLLVRAHAVSVFRMCFESIETLKIQDEKSTRKIVEDICFTWTPFFLDVINAPLPAVPTDAEDRDSNNATASDWRGIIALKVQVVLTLAKVQALFPDVLPTQELFTACWTALQTHASPYFACFVDGNKEANLVSTYDLAYSLDMLVIEELDFLLTLLDAPAVKAKMDEMTKDDAEGNGTTITKWISELMGVLVTFSIITTEQQELWNIDFNVFLSEETLADANNSPRNVCAAFVYRICSWLPVQTLDSLLGYMKLIWADARSTWRYKEAALYVLQQIVLLYEAENRVVEVEILESCVQYIDGTLTANTRFLRARGHTVMAAVMTTWVHQTSPALVLEFAYKSLAAMENDDSEIVKTSCIRIMSSYMNVISETEVAQMQAKIVTNIANFLEDQDMTDIDEYIDLMDTVIQTLRDLIMANPSSCLNHNALDLIISLAKLGATREASAYALVEEAFESAAENMAKTGPETYSQLCFKILPALLKAMDIPTEDDEKDQKIAVIEIALNLIKILAAKAIDTLPEGFVAATMPRIYAVIFSGIDDFYLYQQATMALNEMLHTDHAAVFAWVEPVTQKGGLEMMLSMTGHLLGPQMDDASAAEVGNLAAEIVEKAGPVQLGDTMRELLQVVAVRVDSAEHASLIQSLVMVFARLALLNAEDVLNFLADIPIGPATGLEIVMKKWLENCTHFVGFNAIRQSVHALISIYGLHDYRFTGIQLQGDLIVEQTSRIKTRSMAKVTPDQYTLVAAELKLIKVLVAELVVTFPSLPSPAREVNLLSVKRNSHASDNSWSTESDNTPGLSPIMADDATQTRIIEFFAANGADPNFRYWYGELTKEEQARLMEAVRAHQMAQAQQQQFLAQ